MHHEQESDGSPFPEQPPTGELPTPLRPQIWVGSLADYNNGDLHGDWLDAARPASEIHANIQRVLASGPAARRGEAPEGWGIFDHDEFGGLQIGEYEVIEEVSRLAQAVAAYGEPFALWTETVDRTEATLDNFRAVYRGHFSSATAYAEELVFDLGGEAALEAVASWLRPYLHIDYAALARNLELNSEISTIASAAGGLYVFDGQ